MVPSEAFSLIFVLVLLCFLDTCSITIKYKSLHATFQESAMINKKDEGSLVPSPTP